MRFAHFACALALALALAWPTTVRSAGSSQLGVVSIEVAEIDQLSPCDVGHAVPTGPLSVGDVDSLNLPVWARDATGAAVLAVGNLTLSAAAPITTQLSSLEASVRAAVDPDLAVHTCVVNATGSCDVVTNATEDTNRHLDLRVAYADAARDDGSSGTRANDDNGDTTGGALRFVFAEDAARAVNVGLSFDVQVAELWVDGANTTRSYIGSHQTPADAGSCLDGEALDGLDGSALVFAVVNTTTEWPWGECTPRDNFTAATARGQLQFEAELRRAVLAVEESASRRWSVHFADGLVGQPRSGIVLCVQYTLCGHLMEIPLAVQSFTTLG